MNLTDDDQKVIEIGLKAIHRQRVFTNKLEIEMRRDSIRRSRIAAKFREQLLRKAFKASGIDYEEILRRQKAEASGPFFVDGFQKIIIAKNRADFLSTTQVFRVSIEVSLIRWGCHFSSSAAESQA